jgi:dipeptidyl aminopeptidase/acylaminoacyl peptidase
MRWTGLAGGAALLAALFVSTPATTAAFRPVQLDDLEGVKAGEVAVLSTLDLSPDGRLLAVERGGALSVADARSGKIVQALGEGLLPRWSPDGTQLAFYSHRSGSLQLWLWRSRSVPRQLTKVPRGIDPDIETRIMGYIHDAFRYSWSPHGDRIVFPSRVAFRIATANQPGTPVVLTTTTPTSLTLQDVFAHPGGGTGGVIEAPNGRDLGFRASNPNEILLNQLFVVETHGGKTTQVTHERATAFNPAWSPDGRTIAFARVSPSQSNMAPPGIVAATAGEIVLVDLGSDRMRDIDRGPGIKFQPHWSPDGTRLSYLASPTFEGNASIRVVGATGNGAAESIALNGPVVDCDWDRAAHGDRFLVSYVGEGRPPFLAAPLIPVTDIANLGRTVSQSVGVWSQDRNGEIAWVDEEQTGVWLSPADRTPPKQVRSFATDSNLKLAKSENVTWRNARHESLEGSLLYPADYISGRRYPLIVDVYPFPRTPGWMNPMSGNQAWAAAGYMVFKPAPRAPHSAPNCSAARAFCAAGEGPAGLDVMVDDVMSGIAELDRRGLIDRSRICLYGHSNGGGVVDYLVTRTDAFKCAVAVAPVLPNWLGTSFLWYDGLGLMSRLAGAKPWENPDAYVELSAVLHLGNVKTPMLLADGDEDGAFLLGSIEMYNALRAAGANVTLLRYPNQGHALTGAALHDFWRRAMAFFATYLRPNEVH